jgi:hypothetical protein
MMLTNNEVLCTREPPGGEDDPQKVSFWVADELSQASERSMGYG